MATQKKDNSGGKFTESEGYGYFLGFIGVVAFSLSLPATRALTPYLSIWDIGLGRSLLAGVAAACILIATSQKFPNRAQIFRLCIIASGITFGFPVLTAVGMQTVPASHGGVVLGGLPLATALFGCFLSRERPSLYFWLLALLGFAIVLAFVVVINGSGVLTFYGGDMALIGAVILAALGYAQGGILAREMGGWQVICWTLVISFPLLIPLTAFLATPANFLALSFNGWSIFFFLALVNSLIGFFWFYKGMSLAGVARVSQIQLLQPFMTFIFAILFLNEKFSLIVLFFVTAIVAVVFLSKKVSISKK